LDLGAVSLVRKANTVDRVELVTPHYRADEHLRSDGEILGAGSEISLAPRLDIGL
jgi:hypothetical protein